MEIRYLDLKEISPEVYTSLWEYDSVIQLEEPTFIKFSPKDTIIQFFRLQSIGFVNISATVFHRGQDGKSATGKRSKAGAASCRPAQ